MVLMKISYRVQAHNIARYDEIWSREVVPLIHEYNFNLLGIWRNIVGPAGEYLELWQFASMAEFDAQWRPFNADARLLAIFQKTGPLVLDEQITLFEPLHEQAVRRQ